MSPTACVITTEDQTVSPARQRALAAAIPGATVHEVGGPHNVCATDPQRFLPPFLEACQSVTDAALSLMFSGPARSVGGVGDRGAVLRPAGGSCARSGPTR